MTPSGGSTKNFSSETSRTFDLCLKVRDKGLDIACLPLPVTLIHLERQSFNGIGTPSFRDYVARYNAWRHQARWGAAIAENVRSRQAADELQMKAMVIAHAHPDFSVGGAEIAAYNLFRTLKARPSYGESIFLARSELASQAHGSIMLRRPGEYLWRQDIGDWFRLRTQNPMSIVALPRVSQNRAPGGRLLASLCQHRRGGPARDQIDPSGLPADRDAARIYRHLQSQWPDGEEQDQKALLSGDDRGLQQLFSRADAAGFLAAQALHPEALRICGRVRVARRRSCASVTSSGAFPRNTSSSSRMGNRRLQRSKRAAPPGTRLRARFGFFGQITEYKGVEILLQALHLIAPDVRAKMAVEINGANLKSQGRDHSRT